MCLWSGNGESDYEVMVCVIRIVDLYERKY